MTRPLRIECGKVVSQELRQYLVSIRYLTKLHSLATYYLIQSSPQFILAVAIDLCPCASSSGISFCRSLSVYLHPSFENVVYGAETKIGGVP